MTKRRNIVTALVVSLLLLFSQSGAQALGNGSCDSGDWCMYRDDTWSNSVLDYTGTVYTYTDHVYYNTSLSPNDRTSSFWNRSVYDHKLYHDYGYQGNVACLSAGNYSAYFPFGGYNLDNDSATSQDWGC